MATSRGRDLYSNTSANNATSLCFAEFSLDFQFDMQLLV
jgi:hypothetical protein